MTRTLFLFTVVLTIQTSASYAHNLFVHLERQADGPDLIDVIFEHGPYPGSGEYNGPLIERGKTWVRTIDGDQPIVHNLSEITRRGTKFLQGKTSTTAQRSIEHSCTWGIYHGQMDYFHGKYLDVKTRDELQQLGKTSMLPLDLVPRIEDDKLSVQVLWQGQPRGGGTVHVWPPGDREKKFKADDEGVVRIPKVTRGTYSFSTVVRFPDETGEFAGESYQGLMHGITLTMPWPLK